MYNDIKLNAKNVIKIEYETIRDLFNNINDNFVNVVNKIKKIKGKVIFTGIGKSGQICKKFSSTFSSTGTPSFFLHPSEALHGDLGMLSKSDIIIAISLSGETEELLKIVPGIKSRVSCLISITGNKEATLVKHSDINLIINVKKEACPLGLAPTSSTTAMLVLGDALAICLLKEKNFKEKDFAMLHPGGSLGRKLLLRVKDLMVKGNKVPCVSKHMSITSTIYEISSKGLGVTGVSNNKNNEIIGIITDGDLRRGLEKNINVYEGEAKDIMTCNPKIITKDKLAVDALRMMKEYKITSLFVVEKENSKIPIGIIHIHDCIKAGLN